MRLAQKRLVIMPETRMRVNNFTISWGFAAFALHGRSHLQVPRGVGVGWSASKRAFALDKGRSARQTVDKRCMNGGALARYFSAQTLVAYGVADFSLRVKSVYSHLWITLCIADRIEPGLRRRAAARRFGHACYIFHLSPGRRAR
jgi:hypothetical protein